MLQPLSEPRAVIRPDGKLAILLLNLHPRASALIVYADVYLRNTPFVGVGERGAVTLTMP